MSTLPDTYHLPCRKEDIAAPEGSTRYAVLPGSIGRARRICERLDHVVELIDEERGHNVFVGEFGGCHVLVVPTGMGPSSTEIVVTELLSLGIRVFLRVGTAGSLQPQTIRVPSVVIATAAVRDEDVSSNYCPIQFPAVASRTLVNSLCDSAAALGIASRTFAGPVHTKSALYAREFGHGPLAAVNLNYQAALKQSKILATEMEASVLFTLVQSHQPVISLSSRAEPCEMGAVLAIVGDDTPFSNSLELTRSAEADAIAIALDGLLRLKRRTG